MTKPINLYMNVFMLVQIYEGPEERTHTKVMDKTFPTNYP